MYLTKIKRFINYYKKYKIFQFFIKVNNYFEIFIY